MKPQPDAYVKVMSGPWYQFRESPGKRGRKCWLEFPLD